MGKMEDILKAADSLMEEGDKLQLHHQKKDDRGKLGVAYESWYTRAAAMIKQIVPERLEDFQLAYRRTQRKQVMCENYTISDYLSGLVMTRYGGEQVFDTGQVYSARIVSQLAILLAAQKIAPSVLRDLRMELRAEILDDDIEAARGLLKAKHVRSAGVICGVALEAHFRAVADRRGIKLGKANPKLSEYNDALKDAGVYDVPQWRFIQRLADIRNLCAHKKDRDPKPEEVQDLIDGTSKVVKEIM